MSVPSNDTAEHSQRPSLSHGREGWRAGSSTDPDNGSQRASTTRSGNRRSAGRIGRPLPSSQLPPELVSHLTQVLQEQRAFRLDQLATLAQARHMPSDPVRREVDATLRDAARLVLTEIEAALRRIERGRFGRCRRCGEVIPRARLVAMPMSTWCGPCHPKHERALVEQATMPQRDRWT